MLGVKDIINAANLIQAYSPLDDDILTLLAWVWYNDVLSGFSIRHWRRFASVEDAYVKELGEEFVRSRVMNCARAKVQWNSQAPPYEFLALTPTYRSRAGFLTPIWSYTTSCKLATPFCPQQIRGPKRRATNAL